jgi:nucleoside-diphosphate-sugar epimerase
MRVFVAGATGVLGRRVVSLLVTAGHNVSAVARSDDRADLLRTLGATPADVDVFDADAVRRAVAGHEVVLNLATHIPSIGKMAAPGAWAENDRIRVEASRNLVAAAVAEGSPRYVQESIAFLYRDRGREWIDESWPIDPVANLRSATVAESNAARVTAAGHTGVVLRFAAFYGPDSDSTLAMIRLARRRIGAGAGPNAYTSSITTDDAASAVMASLSAPAGLYNVGDDEPVTRREFFAALAGALGVRTPFVAPAGIAKLGGAKAAVLTRSQRLSNRLFVEATGWKPRYRSVRDGWPFVVAAAKASTAERSRPGDGPATNGKPGTPDT